MSNVWDALLIVIIVFGMGIGLIISVYVNDMLRLNPSFNSTIAQSGSTGETIMATARQTTKNFDYLIVFIVGGIAVGAVIMSALIRTHPIFFVMWFILMLILVGITSIFSNVFYEFASNSNFSSIANEFVYLTFIMNNLPLIVLSVSVLSAIVSYGKIGQAYAQV